MISPNILGDLVKSHHSRINNMDCSKRSQTKITVFKKIPLEIKKLNIFRCQIICLEGIISAGKSTLGKSLAYFLNSNGFKAKYFAEYVNDDLLGMFLEDQKKNAFWFQTIMLVKRIQIYKEAKKFADNGGIAIVDRSLPGDFTFAKMQKLNGNISDSQWKVYTKMIEKESPEMPEPLLTVFLKVSPEVAFERLKKRGNQAEIEGYTIEYFKQLDVVYDESFRQTGLSQISVNWEHNLELTPNGRISDKECCKLLLKLALESS